MGNKSTKSIAAATLTLVAAVMLLVTSGCKGRTRESMEPTGDTVRVEIATPGSPTSDNDSTLRDFAEPAPAEENQN